MRSVGCCFVLLCLCFVAFPASATRIIIQDPPGEPILRTPYPVSFTDSCMADLPRGNAAFNDAGCFSFSNQTGSDWSGLTLNLTMGEPTDDVFDCPTIGVNSAFSSASCSYNPNTQQGVLSFSGGLIPTGTMQTFVISESDLDPGSLRFNLVPTLATAPEPPGLLLVGTGLLCAALLWTTRWRARA